MGMPADLAERQNIIDRFQEFLNRDPREDEINRFLNTSSYQMDKYLRLDPAYGASNDYLTQKAKIESLEAIVGRGSKFDPRTVDDWVRKGYSLERILSMVRSDPNYQNLFPDKPAGMSEADYLSKVEDMAVQAEKARDLWAKWNLSNMSDQQLRHIFVGGDSPEVVAAQQEWERVKSLEAAHQAIAGKRFNTDVKLTPTGPVQQLMQGIDTSAPNSSGSPIASPGATQMTYDDFARQQGGYVSQQDLGARVPPPEIAGKIEKTTEFFRNQARKQGGRA